MFQTDKILIRACEPGDLDLMYQWENNSAWWLVSETTKPFSKYTLEEFIKQDHSDIFTTKQQRFVIELKRPSKAIGLVDLFAYDPLNRRAGVGILIGDEAERSKHYATQALMLLHNYAFEALHINHLFCYIQQSNKASLKLFENSGYRCAGILKQWILNDGEFEDVGIYQRFQEGGWKLEDR